MTKDAQYLAILAEAHAAGMTAGVGTKPVPMIVGSPTTPFGDDINFDEKTYYVADGACGFATIHFKGNTSFGRWALKNADMTGVRKHSYYGGLYKSVHEFNQSLARKENYARAFVNVLTSHGIDAHMQSRMD